MNILREGPKHLIVQSDDCKKSFEQLKQTFKTQFAVAYSENMYNEYLSLIGLLDDKSTIVLISREMRPKLSFEYDDFDYIVAIEMTCEDLLIQMLRLKDQIDLKDIRSTPRKIVMRTTGDSEVYIETVRKDVKGDLVTKAEMFESYGHGTVIIFTDKNINSALSIDDMHPWVIHTSENISDLIKYLNNHRVKYVNASIGNKDWSELIIKIYDSYERYDIHYKRLSMILNEMNCGLVLGESWGRDSALAFLSVGVYQLRLFTYLDPLEVKKIALALEYDVDGERLVDYDLYTKRKKHSWSDVREGMKIKRDELGQYYRKKLVESLDENIYFELLTLEHQLKR